MMFFSGSQQQTTAPRPTDEVESGEYVCTTTATSIPSLPTALVELCIQADTGNKTNVLIGGTATQAIVLAPGASFVFGELNNAEAIYVKKAEAKDAKINWIVRLPEIV